MSNNDCDWFEYKKLILETDKELNSKIKELNELMLAVNQKQTEILVEIGKLQVKSGLWGALGGAISVISIILIKGLGS